MEFTAHHHSHGSRTTPATALGMRLIVTLLFGSAGLLNLALATNRADLVAWGFPDGSQIAIGGAEWLGAAMLWQCRTRFVGYMILAVIIAGACVTVLAMGLQTRFPAPAAFAITLALAASTDRKGKK